MSDRRNARIGFPTEEEMTLVRQLVKDELGRLGITVKSISRLPSGATGVGAQIPAEKMSAATNALFAHGIILVKLLKRDCWGLAIRK